VAGPEARMPLQAVGASSTGSTAPVAGEPARTCSRDAVRLIVYAPSRAWRARLADHACPAAPGGRPGRPRRPLNARDPRSPSASRARSRERARKERMGWGDAWYRPGPMDFDADFGVDDCTAPTRFIATATGVPHLLVNNHGGRSDGAAPGATRHTPVGRQEAGEDSTRVSADSPLPSGGKGHDDRPGRITNPIKRKSQVNCHSLHSVHS